MEQDNKVTSINKASVKPVTVTPDIKGNDFVLKADIQAANKYTLAYLSADNAIENAEREFCRDFATNHEGHLKPAIKAGFAALKAAGVFDGLSKQTIDNLSSAAQWIALQEYNLQDDLFESMAFRKAYHYARWTVSDATETDEQAAGIVTPQPKAQTVSHVPHAATVTNTFNEACNEIAMELNSVVEHINEVINQYPANTGNASLELLAREIGQAIEKAAHARLQAMQTNTVALAA